MLRLMTHNVWNNDTNQPAWAARGEDCSAEARVGALVRIYGETLPDVIGGQEVSARMADLIKEGCAAADTPYTLIWGRYTPILYRADRLELVDSAFLTYPEQIEGLDGSFNDYRSKSMNLAVFRSKESGSLFIFVSTHLWWKNGSNPKDKNYLAGSDEAREWQVHRLSEEVDRFRLKYGCPAVVVGDLNTGYRSRAISYLLGSGYRHAHDIATEYADEAMGYHYCFPDGYRTEYFDRPFEAAIDHILLLGEPLGAVKRFVRYSPDYYFPISDHSPAYIDLDL